jgi:hypothetical protein
VDLAPGCVCLSPYILTLNRFWEAGKNLKLHLNVLAEHHYIYPLGWSTTFFLREIFIFLFRKISYREILRNFAKYCDIFVMKLNFSQGKIHF